MPNWAVVIGIDRYAAPRLSLKGAVRDALAMTDFLTSGEPPLVEPARVLLLLSRAESSPEVPAHLQPRGATRAEIRDAFIDVARKPRGRLFVHYSGHGVMAPGMAGGEAILPANYDDDPGIAIRLEGIRDFLRTSRFDEQFFFVDACRNAPLSDTTNIGQFPVTPAPHEMRPEVQQFVYCATLRGITAQEDRRVPNDERGVFTEPLLRGLRGTGQAKTFDEESGQYVVTTGRLLRFIRQEVRKTIAALGMTPSPENPALQEPRLLGEMGDTELPIVTLTPAQVAPVTLRFDITPSAATATAIVRVRGEGEVRTGPPITTDTALQLPPRDYRVLVEADGLLPAKASWRTDLYEDTRLKLELRPPLQTQAFEAFQPLEETSLDVRSTDPHAAIEVLDAHDRLVAIARERIALSGLDPDLYRARLLTTEGASVERTFDVEIGEQVEALIEAPAATPSLVRRALAFEGARAGSSRRVQVLAIDGERVSRVDSRVVEGEPGASVPSMQPPQIRNERLMLTLDNSERVFNVALPTIDGWETRLLIDEDRTSSAQMRAALVLVKEGFSDDSMALLETAERYLHAGLFRAALVMTAGEEDCPLSALIRAYALLRLTLTAPVRSETSPDGSTRPYAVQLADLVRHLTGGLPAMPDTKLLEAELAMRDDNVETAAVSCQQALDLGVPFLAFGAIRLATHARSLNVQHSRRAELERAAASRVPGWPWTAWWE